MKRLLLISILSLTAVFSAEAQLLKFNKKSEPGHLKFSDYQPEKNKREEKKLRKQESEQLARSYTPQKSRYYDKKEYREARYNQKRQKRAQQERWARKEKNSEPIRKDANKKYSTRLKNNSKDVNKNKRAFGGKKSKKSLITLSSRRYNLDNVYESPAPKKNKATGKRKKH